MLSKSRIWGALISKNGNIKRINDWDVLNLDTNSAINIQYMTFSEAIQMFIFSIILSKHGINILKTNLLNETIENMHSIKYPIVVSR